MIETLDELNKIQTEGRAKRVAAEQELTRIKDELKQKMMEIRTLNKPLFGKKLNNLDFAKYTKDKFGIEAVEYVNQFFQDKAKDETYLAEMKKRAADVRSK